jgi:hypothetical protein
VPGGEGFLAKCRRLEIVGVAALAGLKPNMPAELLATEESKDEESTSVE